MAINKDQLRYLITTTLKDSLLYSNEAVELLMGTAAQESAMGAYLYQINGPALGIFQMEPATEGDIWTNYLYRKESLAAVARTYRTGAACELAWNLKYAILMARIHYYRIKESLPDHSDVPAMAAYWKLYYNTPKGRGTDEEFIRNFYRHVKN